MPSIDVDWTNVIDSLPEAAPQRELIPADTYTVRVEKAEDGVSKTGNAKIEMTLVVTEGEYKGRVVWGRINFAKNSLVSMGITVDQLAQFGVTRKWLSLNNPSNAQIASRLIGQVVTVKVGHREYEGTTYYDVKGYKAVAAEKDDSIPF